jgi:hypothetical protein
MPDAHAADARGSRKRRGARDAAAQRVRAPARHERAARLASIVNLPSA